MQSYISSFTTSGISSIVNGDACDVFVAGTFDGSITLEVQDAKGNWLALNNWTDETSSLNHQSAFSRNWRLNCTELNSGSISYEISAGKFRDLKA